MRSYAILLALSIISLSSAHPIPGHRIKIRAAFTLSNGQDAQKLNSQFRSLKSGSSCSTGQVACTSNGSFAQCVSGKLVTTPCASGTKCFALPLVNKIGTSVTCDTESDAQDRITATGATGGIFGNGSKSSSKSKKITRDVNDDGNGVQVVQPNTSGGAGVEEVNQGITTSTSTTNLAGADAQVQATSTTQSQNQQQATVTVTLVQNVQATGTTRNGDGKHRHHHDPKDSDDDDNNSSDDDDSDDNDSDSDDSNDDSNDGSDDDNSNGDADDGSDDDSDDNDNSDDDGNSDDDDQSSVDNSNNDQSNDDDADDNSSDDFQLENGQEAQNLNSQFASLSSNSTCQNGQEACLNGEFAQCVDGSFVTTACSNGLSCFAVPLVNKQGTSIVCDTEDDALARIQATGASGGLTGQRL